MIIIWRSFVSDGEGAEIVYEGAEIFYATSPEWISRIRVETLSYFTEGNFAKIYLANINTFRREFAEIPKFHVVHFAEAHSKKIAKMLITQRFRKTR